MPAADEYVARYRALGGPALILDDEIAVRVGEPVVYDWYALSLLFSSGHLSFEPWSRRCAGRQYAVVVLNPWQRNEWSERLREAALASGYRLTRLDSALRSISPTNGVAPQSEEQQNRAVFGIVDRVPLE